MLKKEITFENLDGEDVTETFYFGLMPSELADMELSAEGGEGYEALFNKAIASNDGATVMAMFKRLIGDSIGVRSLDNVEFIKNDSIRNRFVNSDAYSVLFMELMSDTDKVIEFVKGIMPAKLQKKMAAQESGKLELPENAKVKLDGVIGGTSVAPLKKIAEYSISELTAMPYPVFKTLLDSTNPGSLSRDVLLLAIQRRP